MRTGVSRSDFTIKSGWPHVQQSLNVIMTTALGERVQRRDFGTDIGPVIDRPQDLESIVSAYSAIAEAVRPRLVDGKQYGEPGFELRLVKITPSANGNLIIDVEGLHFPRGHLGDFTNPEPVSWDIPVG